MKVTVIIPVYNTKKYLKRCVESVIGQSYTNLEILLIDDGSTDESSQICDEFAQKDNRIKVVHKVNGGLSSARNEGMKIAQGEYIAFLDSDDYLAHDFVEQSIKMCVDKKADISIMQMCYIAESTNEELAIEQKEEIKVLNAEEAIKASFYQVLYSCCAPSKLYHKHVLEGIEFPVGKLSEDLAVCHRILHNASTIAYTNAVGYYYRQHGTSIMHVFKPGRMDALRWTREIELFCQKEYPHIINAAKCRTFNVAVHLLLDLPDYGEMHDKYYKEIWKEIKRCRVQTIFDGKVRFREKAAAILSFGGEKLLKKIWNSKMAVKQKSR